MGSESHFFRDLPRLVQTRPSFRQQLASVGDLSTEHGAQQVVDYIFSVTDHHYYFWNLHAKQVDREEFLHKFLQTDRSERALFDLVLAVHANGKPIRGEKTPAHIYFVPKLLEWFSNTKVIHTFRDPRAIYVSSKKKSEKKRLSRRSTALRRLGVVFELYASLHLILTWLQVARLHRRYQQQYPNNYCLSRYEDLVVKPEASLQRLCNFLDIEFTAAMLEQTVVNSSYVPKGQVTGFDASAVDRWRNHLHPVINRWFLLWCRKHLLEFGYQP